MAINLIATRNQIVNGSVIDPTHTSNIYDILIRGSSATDSGSIFNGMEIDSGKISNSTSNTMSEIGLSIGSGHTHGGLNSFTFGYRGSSDLPYQKVFSNNIYEDSIIGHVKQIILMQNEPDGTFHIDVDDKYKFTLSNENLYIM